MTVFGRGEMSPSGQGSSRTPTIVSGTPELT